MVFQLWSHSHLFAEGHPGSMPMKMRRIGKHTMFKEAKSVRRAQAAAGSHTGGGATGGPALENGEANEVNDDDEEEQPSINFWSCIILLLVDAALVGVTAEWLVDSINGLVAGGGITEQWVGLILLPIGKYCIHRSRIYSEHPPIHESVTLRNTSRPFQFHSRTSWIYQVSFNGLLYTGYLTRHVSAASWSCCWLKHPNCTLCHTGISASKFPDVSGRDRDMVDTVWTACLGSWQAFVPPIRPIRECHAFPCWCGSH